MEGKISYEDFVKLHEPQLRNSDIPERFWSSAHRKLSDDVWDLSTRVELNRILVVDADGNDEFEDCDKVPSTPRAFAAEPGISLTDNSNVFLVDHAWTLEVPSARQVLRKYPNLLVRMCDIMDIPNTSGDSENLIEQVLTNMWKFVNTYTFNCSALETEQKLPRWYVMDEIGSSVAHSSLPNCRIVPFYYIPQETTYSLLFPINDIETGEELTRNYVENLVFDDPLTLQCRLLPWVPSELQKVGFEPRPVRPGYFGSSKLVDSLPVELNPNISKILSEKGYLAVYAEYDVLRNSLTDPRFRFTDEQFDADILWYNRHFSDFRAFSEEFPDKFVNQFPFESVLTVKDLLAIVCRRSVPQEIPIVDPLTLESKPSWLPTTYNMDTELPSFVSYFLARQEKGLDNLWIVKPWNLSRSLDITISSHLDCLLRLPETGPKLISKYIEKPILFRREDVSDGPVKFDIRLIALLKSVKPLEVAVYKKFWLRFANKPYDLSDFDIYDKHFTVMNYGQGLIHQMFCDKFIEEFEKQYPDQKWTSIENEIHRVIRHVFQAAVDRDAPEGIAPSSQSRAVFGLDFMLKWSEHADGTKSVQPVLLEVNYSPDCKRACDYYSSFYNELFGYLFLDEVTDNIAML